MVALAGAKGHPPSVKIEPVQLTEQQKYEKMWEIDDYRIVAPGENSVLLFLQQANPKRGGTCIDFGCGTGRGGLMLALMGQLDVTLVDFAANCLDEEVREATKTNPDRIRFVQQDLSQPLNVHALYGYCTDVMEHIPPEQVQQVLAHILVSAQHVFFQICNTPDHMGQRIGHPLHLTVQPYEWWLKEFRKHNCVVHWSHNEKDQYCYFYVSAWSNKDEVEYSGSINTDFEVVKDHVRQNIKGNWQRIHPHPVQDTEIMMICGGPSLNDYTDEIIELRAKGMPMVTTNGTYNWAIANGMKPSMQLILDAREFNNRFVKPVVDGCKYMIASQCHPSVFEGLPEERTYLWHVGTTTDKDGIAPILDEAFDWWFPTPGGSTVTLRGLFLLRMLGFLNIHMYGFDSCYREDQHHAYQQAENDNRHLKVRVSCGGTRTFMCDPWMYAQADEFIRMIPMLGDELQLNVKGDGLIAHIIETNAMLYREEQENEG